MKPKALLCAAILVALAACSRTHAAASADSHSAREVESVVQAFYRAADRQDLEALDSLLHPEFRLVVTRPDMEAQVVDKQEFLVLMMTNLIGGRVRTIDGIEVRASGDRALAHVTLEGPSAAFDAMQTYVKDGSRWTLLHSLTQYDPKN